MARTTWRRVLGTVFEEWTKGSLMLDPMAYAAYAMAVQAAGAATNEGVPPIEPSVKESASEPVLGSAWASVLASVSPSR